MYDNIGESYPSEFFFNISKLKGSLSKNLIKVSADRDSASPGNITNLRLPIGSLLQMKSTALWFKITTTGTNVAIPARYASSFIKRLSLTMNNTTVAIIQDYNLLYNIYADHNNKDKTKGIGGEFVDNSIIWTETDGGSVQSKISGQNSMLAGVAHFDEVQMCINNWIGFLGSDTSTSILPTDRIGEAIISIEWENPANVLGGTAEATTVTYSDNSYSVSDIYLTCESLSFSDDSYYQSIGNKDLQFKFSDYIVTRFADVEKKAGINVTTYMSAGSIDHIFGTCVQNITAVDKMYCWGSKGSGSADTGVTNLYRYLSDPEAFIGNNSGLTTQDVVGDGFFSTGYFQRNLQHLETSTFSINNKMLNYAPLNPYEIFQNNLCALGYEGIDASANGLNPTIVSLKHYYKYYGACFQSLELINKDEYYISGLSSQGSSCAVNWQAKFSGTSNTLKVTPVIVAKLSKVLHVKAGRVIQVE